MARALLLDEGVALLTLIGPGGVGKTRLALATAGDVHDQFRDGVLWVDLAPLTSEAAVPVAVAAAAGLSPSPDDDPVEILQIALRRRQTLLLIDNCEHVLPATAAVAGALLPECPSLQVLATSRAPLRVRGEQEFPVEPLSLPGNDVGSMVMLAESEAVQLFAERARAVYPAFALSERNAESVAAICRQLDGLPLAIELAAARSKLLEPGALLTQLGDRLGLLDEGARDAPARQRTMRDTIAWSYDLLAADQQRLLRRLSVFVGGFTLEAAEFVERHFAERGAEPRTSSTVIDLVGRLVDQSLVRRSDDGGRARFTMLETVRAYCQERLEEAGEISAARDAHAVYFVFYTGHDYRPLAGAPLSSATEQIAPALHRASGERANIRAALQHLMETNQAEAMLRLASVVWSVELNPQEGRGWLEWALAHTPDEATVARGIALAHLAWEWWTLGDYARAQHFAEASLDIARQLDDELVTTHAINALAFIALIQEDYARARPLFTDVVPRWRAHGDRQCEADALQALAAAEHLLGEDEIAVEHIDEALAIYHELGEKSGLAIALLVIGQMARDRGNDYAGLITFQAALELAFEASDRYRLAWALVVLAEIASRHEQAEVAASLLGGIDTLSREAGASRLSFGDIAYDRTEAAAIAALGEERFAAVRAAGQRLWLDDVLVLARGIAVPLIEDEQIAFARAYPRLSGLVPTSQSTSKESGVSPVAAAGVAFPWLSASSPPVMLTNRERDVLDLLCQRLTNAEIAERLYVSPRTVGTHVEHLLAKLGAANRREAVAIATRYGLI